MALSLIYSDVIGYAACTLVGISEFSYIQKFFARGSRYGKKIAPLQIIPCSFCLGIVLAAYQKYLNLVALRFALFCHGSFLLKNICFGIWLHHDTGHGTNEFVFIFVLMLIHNYMTKRNQAKF